MFAQANPPPRTIPSLGVRGHPASTKSVRTPLVRVSKVPTIVEFPTLNRCASSREIFMLEPWRFASPACAVKLLTSQSTPALRKRSFEFFSDKYSAMSRRPAKRAFCSASATAAIHASSSSLKLMFSKIKGRLLVGCWIVSHKLAAEPARWYHDRRSVPHNQSLYPFERGV